MHSSKRRNVTLFIIVFLQEKSARCDNGNREAGDKRGR